MALGGKTSGILQRLDVVGEVQVDICLACHLDDFLGGLLWIQMQMTAGRRGLYTFFQTNVPSTTSLGEWRKHDIGLGKTAQRAPRPISHFLLTHDETAALGEYVYTRCWCRRKYRSPINVQRVVLTRYMTHTPRTENKIVTRSWFNW